MTGSVQSTPATTERFRAARGFLLAHGEDYDTACRDFRWPELEELNWALDWFGRADDVFKASDYLISPFELESVLVEHDAVAEAAVVPSPDPLRLAVPKAYIQLAPGQAPSRDAARAILAWSHTQLAPFKRVRRLEFAELPKTISGKIRRVDLRDREQRRRDEAAAGDSVSAIEYSEADFPELKR